MAARARAHTTSSTSFKALPTLLSIQILLSFYFLLCLEPSRPLLRYLVDAASGDAAGGEPGRCWGPCEGGRPRVWPGLSRAPTRTPQPSNKGVAIIVMNDLSVN